MRQNFTIRARPEEVFQAIINPLTIELWSGYPAQMEAREGFEFSMFDGSISGRNLKIIPDRRLVQQWYFGDVPEQSVVTIDLIPFKNRTKVELEHTNVPDEVYEEFEEGWRKYYWGAVIEYFK
ncbi:MAG: SRPBCC domain-containing protein [Bacteroidales bacterium]|nr:SRPBCC domain-containing protein [Bacteroidales bacterium]